MKVNLVDEKRFTPVKLEITLESQKEVDQLAAIFDTLPVAEATPGIKHIAILESLPSTPLGKKGAHNDIIDGITQWVKKYRI
jgi:hypothetical protein